MVLTAFRDYFDKIGQEQLALVVRVCKVAKMYDSAQKKIWLSFNEVHLVGVAELQVDGQSHTLRLTLLAALKELGRKMTTGKAPPGHMERELSKYLAALDGGHRE